MPVLTVRHVTTYRYRQPVAFGEHRMMLRPREGHDQRLFEARLDITPKPTELRWLHDVFGNSVAIARFAGRARELRFESVVKLDHRPHNPLDFQIEDYARDLPLRLRHGGDARPGALDRAALARRRPRGGSLGAALPAAGRRDRHARPARGDDPRRSSAELTYVPRHERGIQDPVKTLKLGSGTCRDFAVLMMEAARSLGLAARFVSGYLYSPGANGGGDASAAAPPMPGRGSTCRAPAGSNSTRPTASSATAT